MSPAGGGLSTWGKAWVKKNAWLNMLGWCCPVAPLRLCPMEQSSSCMQVRCSTFPQGTVPGSWVASRTCRSTFPEQPITRSMSDLTATRSGIAVIHGCAPRLAGAGGTGRVTGNLKAFTATGAKGATGIKAARQNLPRRHGDTEKPGTKIFLDDLSNSGSPFVVIVKAGISQLVHSVDT